jgi:hypothetical protein
MTVPPRRLISPAMTTVPYRSSNQPGASDSSVSTPSPYGVALTNPSSFQKYDESSYQVYAILSRSFVR